MREHNRCATTQAHEIGSTEAFLRFVDNSPTDTLDSLVSRALDDAMPGTPGTRNPLISRAEDYTGYA